MPSTFREPCPKHPSMKGYCACQISTRGTTLPPKFSVVETEYAGYPVIELLKNGGPMHMYDSHFRFGVRKAEMLLACLDGLKEFAWASDDERRAFGRRLYQEGPRAVLVTVEFRDYFQLSTGGLVNQPWLRLESPSG